MSASAITILILLLIIVIGVIYILISRNYKKEYAIIQDQNEILEENINSLQKKAKDVKDEKKPDNIDDLLMHFSNIKR